MALASNRRTARGGRDPLSRAAKHAGKNDIARIPVGGGWRSTSGGPAACIFSAANSFSAEFESPWVEEGATSLLLEAGSEEELPPLHTGMCNSHTNLAKMA